MGSCGSHGDWVRILQHRRERLKSGAGEVDVGGMEAVSSFKHIEVVKKTNFILQVSELEVWWRVWRRGYRRAG